MQLNEIVVIFRLVPILWEASGSAFLAKVKVKVKVHKSNLASNGVSS